MVEGRGFGLAGEDGSIAGVGWVRAENLPLRKTLGDETDPKGNGETAIGPSGKIKTR